MIERIVHLGFEARVELVLADGEQLWAQMTRAEAGAGAGRGADRLRAAAGKKVFEPNGEPRTEELAAW